MLAHEGRRQRIRNNKRKRIRTGGEPASFIVSVQHLYHLFLCVYFRGVVFLVLPPPLLLPTSFVLHSFLSICVLMCFSLIIFSFLYRCLFSFFLLFVCWPSATSIIRLLSFSFVLDLRSGLHHRRFHHHHLLLLLIIMVLSILLLLFICLFVFMLVYPVLFLILSFIVSVH